MFARLFAERSSRNRSITSESSSTIGQLRSLIGATLKLGTIDTKRLIFPALGGIYQSIAPYSYAIIRFCAGAIVIYHGYMKLFGGFAGPVAQNVLTPLGFPAPLAWAYFLGILEFFGGAALAVGFLTRPLALMFTVQMAIVTYWLARAAAGSFPCC
jgi:uncharacterized membrane protein YphA (DoxX/SURF4 family)